MKEEKENDFIRVEMKVIGMMCQKNCGTTVANALRNMEGCVEADASFSSGTACATFNVAKFNTSTSNLVSFGGDEEAFCEIRKEIEDKAIEEVEDVGFECFVFKENDSKSIQIKLKVIGMMCQKNCGTTVANALLNIEGCIEAEASFSSGTADATFNIAKFNAASSKDEGHVSDDIRKMIEEKAVEEVEDVGFDCHVFTQKDLDNEINGVSHLTEESEDNKSDVTSPLIINQEKSDCPSGVFEVSGMSCAVCTGKVEKTLLSVDGVESATVSLMPTGRAHVQFSNDNTYSHTVSDMVQQCVDAVTNIGYECSLLTLDNVDSNEDSGIMGISLRDNAIRMKDARELEYKTWRKSFLLSLVFTIPLILIHHSKNNIKVDPDEKLGNVFFVPSWQEWAMLCLATPVQFGVGRRFYVNAYSSIRHGGVIGMDALVILGTTAAYSYSLIVFLFHLYLVYFGSDDGNLHENLQTTFETGAMLLTFITFGKTLEAYAKGKTASALQKLMELQPVICFRVLEGKGINVNPTDIDENTNIHSLDTEQVDVSELKMNDLLIVPAGSRIPTDGVILGRHGTGKHVYIDESALSGEPFPVPKGVGDTVYGSCVNQLNMVLMRVSAVGSNTVLARIVKLVEDAQSSRAPIQAYADRIASVFAPIVVCISLITFFSWLFQNPENPFDAIMSAIAVVVVACPCALGLATPTAVMCGTGVGANNGLLIKGGDVLEAAHSVDTVIFDKTGTLTTGKAVLADCIEYLDSSSESSLIKENETSSFNYDTDLSNESLTRNIPRNVPRNNIALWLATCAEIGSEHPLASAVVNGATKIWGGDAVCAGDGVLVSNAKIEPGQGVECIVEKEGWGKRMIRVGKKSFITGNQDDGNKSEAFDEDLMTLRKKGQIGIYVGVISLKPSSSYRIIGVMGIVDPICSESPSCVKALQNMGVDVWLCTGDHESTAAAVAYQLGIPRSNICAGISPEGKADLVTRLQKSSEKRSVAVVGDGINDSIALARANVGIAIGAGTEVAVEAADIVLVRNSLHDIVVALHLSRVVFRRIKMNFVWAMGYNVIALPFAAGLFYSLLQWKLPPAFAGLMMALSSVSVVSSSLLLKLYTRPIIDDDGIIRKNGCCSIGDKGRNLKGRVIKKVMDKSGGDQNEKWNLLKERNSADEEVDIEIATFTIT